MESKQQLNDYAIEGEIVLKVLMVFYCPQFKSYALELMINLIPELRMNLAGEDELSRNGLTEDPEILILQIKNIIKDFEELN